MAFLLHQTKKTSVVKNIFRYAQKMVASPSPSLGLARARMPRAGVLRDGPGFPFSTSVSDKVSTGGDEAGVAAEPGIWCSWKSPGKNKLKFNVDAACDLKTYIVNGVRVKPQPTGISGVLRDGDGIILLGFIVRIAPVDHPVIAEFFALRYAMRLLYQPNTLSLNKESIAKLHRLKEKLTKAQFESVIFESDSEEVADKFAKKPQKLLRKLDNRKTEAQVYSTAELKTYLILDIRDIMALMPNVTVVFVYRQSNVLADHLSKTAQELPTIWEYSIIENRSEVDEDGRTIADGDASGVLKTWRSALKMKPGGGAAKKTTANGGEAKKNVAAGEETK